MKVSLIGFGKMGQELFKQAAHFNIEICSIIDPTHSQATHKSITLDAVKHADVCIDFSSPHTVMDNITKLAQYHKPMVIGTTGWDKHFQKVDKLVKENNIGLIYAANFSIGVYLFGLMVERAAFLIDKFSEFDIAGHEIHHNQKLDSPSGTALYLTKLIQKQIHAKNNSSFSFSSSRVGHVVGEHQVIIDSQCDRITLNHSAKNRSGYAQGALKAALWIRDKKGCFSIEDFINEVLQKVTP